MWVVVRFTIMWRVICSHCKVKNDLTDSPGHHHFSGIQLPRVLEQYVIDFTDDTQKVHTVYCKHVQDIITRSKYFKVIYSKTLYCPWFCFAASIMSLKKLHVENCQCFAIAVRLFWSNDKLFPDTKNRELTGSRLMKADSFGEGSGDWWDLLEIMSCRIWWRIWGVAVSQNSADFRQHLNHLEMLPVFSENGAQSLHKPRPFVGVLEWHVTCNSIGQPQILYTSAQSE